jgi:hypothetical protein
MNTKNKIIVTLLFFLSINLSQAQDITVTSGTAFQISSGVIFHVNGLTLTPSATFDLDGLSITKNAAITQSLPSGNTNASITRAYTFSATSPSFSGAVRVDYEDNELNNITEADLEVNYYDGTAWNQVSTASRDVSTNYVISGALTSQTLREITLASSSAALPVTWLNFTAARQDKAVLLNWSTAQELNTLDFVVQHSTDAKNFTNVASQPAAGNSNVIQNYYYEHTSPVMGYNYYRLHQRDFDGESSYSEIRSVKLNTALNTNDVRVLGNPLQTNELTLVTPIEQEIALYDMVGKLCLKQQLEAGSHTLDVSFLPKGMYLVQTATSSQKIIKL